MTQAVERLCDRLPLKDKTTVANMSPNELSGIHSNLGRYIMDNFGLLSGHRELMKSYRSVSKEILRHEEDAVTVIITTRQPDE